MVTVDTDNLSLADMKSPNKELTKAIADFSNRKTVEGMNALEEHAKALGFRLAELTGKTGCKARAGSGAATYRLPENPDLTWSGLGRRPRGFISAIKSGKAAEAVGV